MRLTMKKLFLVLGLVEIFALHGSGKQNQTPVVEEIVITLGSMTFAQDSNAAFVTGEFTPNPHPAPRKIAQAKRTVRKFARKK